MTDKILVLERRPSSLDLLNLLLIFTGVILVLLLLPNVCTAEQINISGLTEPVEDSALGLSAIGLVSKIHVHEGETVKKGQLLLELNQKLEKLEVERRKLIWKSKAELESVTLQVKTLAQHLQASRDLYQSTGSIPQEELENKELEYAFAVAERYRLEIAEQREKNEYLTAAQQLAKRNLYAPFTGKIAEIKIGIGENCEIDTALIRLVDTKQIVFVANMELPNSQPLRLGQKVEIHFDNGLESIQTEGTISFISPLLDPASGLQTVKVELANEDNLVVPGMAGQLILADTTAPGEKATGQVTSD